MKRSSGAFFVVKIGVVDSLKKFKFLSLVNPNTMDCQCEFFVLSFSSYKCTQEKETVVGLEFFSKNQSVAIFFYVSNFSFESTNLSNCHHGFFKPSFSSYNCTQERQLLLIKSYFYLKINQLKYLFCF